MGDVLKDLTDFHLKTKEIPDILLDEHNCELFDQVHPIKWTDPKAEVSQGCKSRDSMMSWLLVQEQVDL